MTLKEGGGMFKVEVAIYTLMMLAFLIKSKVCIKCY
ncbi:Uncharacterised protein [Salmonella enterica]|nr:Uncharacterised protein [Salmonella enterica]